VAFFLAAAALTAFLAALMVACEVLALDLVTFTDLLGVGFLIPVESLWVE
jgi:hypothetical protein